MALAVQTGLGGRLGIVTPAQSYNPAQLTEIVAGLQALRQLAGLELRATAEQIQVSAHASDQYTPEVGRILRGRAPDWEVYPLPPRPSLAAWSSSMTGVLVRPGVPDIAPLKSAADFRVDPLLAVLEAVQPQHEHDCLVIRYALSPASRKRVAAAFESLFMPPPSSNLWELFASISGRGPRVPRFASSLQKELEARLAEPLFEVLGFVTLSGTNAARLRSQFGCLATVFDTHFDGGYGGLALEECTVDPASGKPCNPPPSLLLTAAEVAALWAPPSASVRLPGVQHSKGVSVLLPRAITRAEGPLIGMHQQRGEELPVSLERAAIDRAHLACIGATGQGKSTAVEQLCWQLGSAADRPSQVIIDPHGLLAADWCRRSVPEGREADVVWLELGDTTHPPGLPFFEHLPGVPEDIQVQTTFSLLKLLFKDEWSATRMEDAVWALTVGLCRQPGATLLDARPFFTDRRFRRQVTAGLQDAPTREWIADYEQLSDSARAEVMRPILYRLRKLYRSPAVRNLLCAPSGPDFAALINEGTLLCVSLAGPAIQAEATLLGELVLAKLQLALWARLAAPHQPWRQVYLVLDESQNFRGASLPRLLSEARKLRVALLLLTQFLDGWDEALCNAVLGNVGTLISFRVGPNDSRRLAAQLKPFSAEQIENLSPYEAIVRLRAAGVSLPAFDVRTLPIDRAADDARLQRIRDRSRFRYGRPRAEIQAEREHQAPVAALRRRREDCDED